MEKHWQWKLLLCECHLQYDSREWQCQLSLVGSAWIIPACPKGHSHGDRGVQELTEKLLILYCSGYFVKRTFIASWEAFVYLLYNLHQRSQLRAWRTEKVFGEHTQRPPGYGSWAKYIIYRNIQTLREWRTVYTYPRIICRSGCDTIYAFLHKSTFGSSCCSHGWCWTKIPV